MGRVLAQLFMITEQFDMVTQPQLLLLQKTMVTVEGVARSFDPKVNIWDASEKLVGDWLRKSIGPQAILQDMADNAGRTLRMVQRLPDTLDELERGARALQNHQSSKPAARSDRLARLIGLSALGLALATIIYRIL